MPLMLPSPVIEHHFVAGPDRRRSGGARAA
jgi:hypothetical protein